MDAFLRGAHRSRCTTQPALTPRLLRRHGKNNEDTRMSPNRIGLRVPGVLLALLAMAATPALATVEATVTVDCTQFTLTVHGNKGVPVDSLDYLIQLSPGFPGGDIDVGDTIPVTMDADLNFSAAVTRNWSDFGITPGG